MNRGIHLIWVIETSLSTTLAVWRPRAIGSKSPLALGDGDGAGAISCDLGLERRVPLRPLTARGPEMPIAKGITQSAGGSILRVLHREISLLILDPMLVLSKRSQSGQIFTFKFQLRIGSTAIASRDASLPERSGESCS